MTSKKGNKKRKIYSIARLFINERFYQQEIWYLVQGTDLVVGIVAL